ncbi:hypothetical protein ATANTOWER_007118 [Ataeniobius toweri]|uniref:Uncharacterized protein n=1 Tax=Ataeniobius toweri TaxID=208326 RepID=A0ABU7C2E5_9TELE|nr:hypothetical protein [Ataeniobius toweri]
MNIKDSSYLQTSSFRSSHTLFLSVRGSWTDCLHFLLLFLVLSWRTPRTNCLHPWFPFRRTPWTSCLHFLFLSLRGARAHLICLLCLGGSAADLHGLAKGPSGLCTAHLGSSSFCTTPLSSTLGSPGPAAGLQIICSFVAGLLVTCFYIARLLIACSCVASLQTASSCVAVRLNSCPPSEAPSAHLESDSEDFALRCYTLSGFLHILLLMSKTFLEPVQNRSCYSAAP